MSPFDLTGRVAVVTGGNGGIGLGMAEALAAAGSDVAIWGTNPAKNEAAAEVLGQYPGKILTRRCDVGDPDQVTEAFAETVGTLGRVDAFFANAGIGGADRKFVDLSLDEWRQVTRINLDGVFLTFQAAARHMAENGGGSLVAVSSIMGTNVGFPRAQAYAAAKAGVGGLVRSCAVELARYQIRVNAILPGYVRTALADGLTTNEAFTARTMPHLPARRWGVPADLGALAVYLACDASKYQTGTETIVDGGFTLT
ncbi:SDR family NAD(P)-dependent oxidoreductase [Cryptosporangium aurantiacum]|uniref:NAD(P)-dependent dehydrogenase, short-chain alcohol dehydrogenase family n=1 Tax=Cryptosporangium aurantiacum TaxID=134849 RepID=A0A1M7PJ88_9ACTN|nr:SDR family oxidoreductase [Cryptosporangium aurantiacum]SHN17246.1 hypothetical protein SAMN05443668_103417 [Cryptosporangium aurantiacum]